jgi:DNA replication and repair protein RecF
VNGLPTRAVELIGQVNVVLFTPDDVTLVAGPPAGRRRYLDITNSQVSGLYLRTLQRYNRVVVQRNHLLRQVRERRQPREQLEFWNGELVAAGTVVVARRLEMLARMNQELGPIYRQLSGGQQSLQIVYQATSCGESGEPPAVGAATEGQASTELAERYAARLQEVVGRETEQGVSIVGPHRDDFQFLVDGVDLNTYGSRGPQRLAVLSLKLAEGQFMRAESGEQPILLLDDILSELDPARRGFVLEQAGREGQTIITTTDLADFPAGLLERAAVYRVERGALEGKEAGAEGSV